MKTDKWTVSAYLKRDVITVLDTVNIKETLAIMVKHKTNGVVVVDKKNHVKGIFTILDLIRHFVPDYLEADKQLAEFEAADLFATRAKKITKNAIKPLMTKDVITVKEEDSLMEATTRMTELQIRQLPVVDDHGILKGIITRTDIKKAIDDALS